MITALDAISKLQGIFSYASIISNVIVIFTISRNNILKKRPIYVYILSFLINNALYTLCHEILRTYQDVIIANFALYHFWLHMLWIFIIGNILTLIALTLQYPVRRDNYVRFIMRIWIFLITFSVIFTITYFVFDFFLKSVFTVVIFITFFVLLVVHVVCRVIYRKERGDYALQLNFVSVYICCNVLYQFCWFILFFLNNSIVFTVMLSYVRVYVSCYGVVNAISLLFFDRMYKICFLATIKCSKTKYFDTHESKIPDGTLLTTHNPS